MVPPEPPEPSIVAGSLKAAVINDKAFMVVSMTDDSLRVVSIDGGFPTGNSEFAEFSFSTNPGLTPTPPENVPLDWDNFEPDPPSGYLWIEGHLVFVDYDWSEIDEEAAWSCDIISNDVKLSKDSPVIYSGDNSLSFDITNT